MRNEISLNLGKVCVVFGCVAFVCGEIYTPIMN